MALLFFRRSNPYMLVVGMTGVKMGDRIAQIGCAHGGRLAAIAGRVGLSGRALAVVPDEASAERARKGASQAGVLVEIRIGPATRLAEADATFDLVVFDDTAALLASMGPEDRGAAAGEALRIVRPGGRVMVIGAAAPAGLGALFTRAPSAEPFDPSPVLQAAGFRSVRTLAGREGLTFIEALKPRA